MKQLLVLIVAFLMSCSGDTTQTESAAGGAAGPDYTKTYPGEGRWHQPCGKTYTVTVILKDGHRVTREIHTYCKIPTGRPDEPTPEPGPNDLVDQIDQIFVGQEPVDR